jgi:DNA-binding XRE family transcriptional regulator
VLILDRFEGYMAIIKHHNGSTFELPTYLLPDNAKEGDVINIIVDEVATIRKEKNTQKMSFKIFMEIFENKDFVNPIKLFRDKNGYNRYSFAGLINSNLTTLKKVENGDCKDTTAFEIIKKIVRQFNDVDEKEMIRKYLEYKCQKSILD